MTNELAIKILTGDVIGTTEQTHEAINMAVKALSEIREMLETAQPNLQPTCNQLTTDSISRQAVIDALCDNCNNVQAVCPHYPCKQFTAIEALPSAQPEPHWIPCIERLPECEQEVLICTKKKIYISKNSGFEWIVEPIITPALYEDGTMLEVNSKWIWEDIDYAGWDEEEDC